MTGKEWDNFYGVAEELAERQARGNILSFTEDLLVKAAAECKAARLDLPKVEGSCGGCVCHEINRPDGGVLCAAGECIEQEA